MKRLFLAVLAIAALPAAAQAPASPVFKAAPPPSCAECGVVRSVKRVESAPPISEGERKSTAGLVASVPLGGGKPTAGSSTDVRKELKPAAVRFEIVVRLDDGRFQLVVQDDAGDLREGDAVRIDRGRVLRRGK